MHACILECYAGIHLLECVGYSAGARASACMCLTAFFHICAHVFMCTGSVLCMHVNMSSWMSACLYSVYADKCRGKGQMENAYTCLNVPAPACLLCQQSYVCMQTWLEHKHAA